eukprot:3630535-Pleurochrysis_carterae.AAC.2
MQRERKAREMGGVVRKLLVQSAAREAIAGRRSHHRHRQSGSEHHRDHDQREALVNSSCAYCSFYD